MSCLAFFLSAIKPLQLIRNWFLFFGFFLINGIISVFMIRKSQIYSSMNSSWNSVCVHMCLCVVLCLCVGLCLCVQEKYKYRIDTTFFLPICDYSPKNMSDPSGEARKSIGYIIPNNLLAAPEVWEHLMQWNLNLKRSKFPLLEGGLAIYARCH